MIWMSVGATSAGSICIQPLGVTFLPGSAGGAVLDRTLWFSVRSPRCPVSRGHGRRIGSS